MKKYSCVLVNLKNNQMIKITVKAYDEADLIQVLDAQYEDYLLDKFEEIKE